MCLCERAADETLKSGKRGIYRALRKKFFLFLVGTVIAGIGIARTVRVAENSESPYNQEKHYVNWYEICLLAC
jgi:hypothetical protein